MILSCVQKMSSRRRRGNVLIHDENVYDVIRLTRSWNQAQINSLSKDCILHIRLIRNTFLCSKHNEAMSDIEAEPSGSPSSKYSSSQQEALKRLSKIINSFVVRSECSPFIEPVDWRGLELHDYPKVIKKPMDLGTITRKLERNQYVSAAYCAADVRRVWTNCMTYNAVGSDFYLLAKSCSKRFEDRYRRIRNECMF